MHHLGRERQCGANTNKKTQAQNKQVKIAPVYTTKMNSALSALWLAIQTRDSMCCSPPSKTKWLLALLRVNFANSEREYRHDGPGCTRPNSNICLFLAIKLFTKIWQAPIL